MVKSSVFGDFLAFLRHERKWWIIPVAIAVLVVGGLLVLSSSTAAGPFLYPQM